MGGFGKVHFPDLKKNRKICSKNSRFFFQLNPSLIHIDIFLRPYVHPETNQIWISLDCRGILRKDVHPAREDHSDSLPISHQSGNTQVGINKVTVLDVATKYPFELHNNSLFWQFHKQMNCLLLPEN